MKKDQLQRKEKCDLVEERWTMKVSDSYVLMEGKDKEKNWMVRETYQRL